MSQASCPPSPYGDTNGSSCGRLASTRTVSAERRHRPLYNSPGLEGKPISSGCPPSPDGTLLMVGWQAGELYQTLGCSGAALAISVLLWDALALVYYMRIPWAL